MHSDGGHANSDIKFELSEVVEGVPVLGLTGELDMSTSPQLHNHLLGISERDPQVVVVDMTAVSFVDSTALGVLVSAVKRLREYGGDLRLVLTQPHIVKVFEITGLTDVFAIHPTIAEAVQG